MIKKQYGVTLIELMVSMMLGLLLVSGISQLFIQSQKSFSFQRNLSDMTDDGSFLLEILAKGILQAGYSEDGKTDKFTPDSAVLSSAIDFAQDEYIHGTDNELVYRYKLSSVNELYNFPCTTSLNYVSGDVVTVRLYKANDTDGIPVFYCKVKQTSDTTNNAEPLISDVAKLVIKYGIHNKINDTYYYTDQAGVDATANNWQNVFAVKIFIVLRSADNNLTRNKTKYDIENVTYTATDNRLYKVFSKTIYMRAADH